MRKTMELFSEHTICGLPIAPDTPNAMYWSSRMRPINSICTWSPWISHFTCNLLLMISRQLFIFGRGVVVVYKLIELN